VLFLDRARPGQPTEDQVRTFLLQHLSSLGLESFPAVIPMPIQENWTETLRLFPRAQWVHPDPEIPTGMEGPACVRLASQRFNLAQPAPPATGASFPEALQKQVHLPAKGPPWASFPWGTTFLTESSWSEAHLQNVLVGFLEAFGPEDPAACLVLEEAGGDEAKHLRLQAWVDQVQGPGRTEGTRIHWVKEPEALIAHLRKLPKVLRVPSTPGETAGLEGHLGLRLAEALHRRGLRGASLGPSPTPGPYASIPSIHGTPGIYSPLKGGASPKLKVLFFTSERLRHATAQLRVIGPAWAHGDQIELVEGIPESGGAAFNPRLIRDADLILLQRFFPRMETRAVLDAVFSSGKPVLFETDDLVHCIPEENPSYFYSSLTRDFLLDAMARAHALIVTTPVLGEELAPINGRIEVMPNLLDPRIWARGRSSRAPGSGPVIIGYCGTPTHFQDLLMVEEALARLVEKHPGRVAFRFFGCVTPALENLPGASICGFKEGYEAYAQTLMGGGIHIALAPLVDHRFNRCKSAIKWLEYSALGAVGVYSDLAPYQSCVRHGETGFLAQAQPQSWFEILEHLVLDEETRRTVAGNAQQETLGRHMLTPSSPWLGILERALGTSIPPR
jgi:hypothetical protein